MKKIFNPVTIYFLFFGLIFMTAIGASLFNSLTEAGLNPFDYARITDVDYKATLIDEPGHGGKVVITDAYDMSTSVNFTVTVEGNEAPTLIKPIENIKFNLL